MKTKILFWLPMPVIGTLNGVFRGLVLMQFLPEFHAKQVSSLLLVVLLFFYTRFVFTRLRIASAKDTFFTGVVWMLLTVVFEFLLGYVVLRHDIPAMLSEYNLFAGNLWTFVLVAIVLLPYLCFRLTKTYLKR